MCCLSLLINKHAIAKLLRQLRLHNGKCGVWLVACGMWQVDGPATKHISSLSRRLYAKTFAVTRPPIYYWLHATCHMPQAAAGRQRFYAAVKKFHAKLIMFMQRHLYKQRQKGNLTAAGDSSATDHASQRQVEVEEEGHVEGRGT